MTTNTTNDFLARLRKNVSPEPVIIEAAQAVPELPTELADYMVTINPPESALPPAAPVGIAAPVEEKKKRGRKTEIDGADRLDRLVTVMRALGVRYLKIEDMEIELEAK